MNTDLKEKMDEAAKEYIRKTCKKDCRFKLECKGYNEDFSQSDLHTNCRKRYQSFRDGASAMYAELAPIVEWVSVEDRLPENQDIVLIKTDKNCICTGYLHGKESGFITYGEDAFIDFGNITHWRRIEL